MQLLYRGVVVCCVIGGTKKKPAGIPVRMNMLIQTKIPAGMPVGMPAVISDQMIRWSSMQQTPLTGIPVSGVVALDGNSRPSGKGNI